MQHAGPAVVRPLRPPATWDDDALVRGLRRGDGQAFAEIYSRYGFLLLELAYRKTGSRETAEEIVQELFTALWHKRATAGIQKLREYLSAAVRYRVINVLKTKLTHAGFVAHARPLLPEADHRTEEELAAADLSRALRTGLARLPEHARQVFQLSRLEHQTVPQIALRLRLSPKAVEYHLTRALKLLRVSLKDFLVPLALLIFN